MGRARRSYSIFPLIALLAVASLPAGAHAGWPRPAAGSSSSGGPEVVLTFDDGPHERYTQMILDELAARDLQAIFFWVGWRLSRGGAADKRRALVERAVRDGHLIANHTMTHAQLCAVPEQAAAAEIDDNAAILEQLSGMRITLFRAPYGAHCQRLRNLLGARQLDHMHWDIDPQEWTHHDARRTADYVIAKLRHLQGRAVLLMHDTHLSTARALPLVLDWIDQENQRRAERGLAPIRIVSGSQVIAETQAGELRRWLSGTARSATTRWAPTLADLIP